MSERDQFEVWWEEWFGEAPMSGWDNLRTDSGYSAEEIDIQWEAWIGRASREALKAEQGGDGFMLVPVADLYELLHKGGEAYSYTSSASDAVYWVKEGYTVREYVLLDRLQDAMNHPIDTTSQQYEALSKGESK